MNHRAYPSRLAIRTRGPVEGTIRPPGSKSITNRALLSAALATGSSTLTGATLSDDTEAMETSLQDLGVRMVRDGDRVVVQGSSGALRAPGSPLDARASGTTARFLTAAATLADAEVVIDGTERLRERPIRELVATLRMLGADLETLGPGSCLPVRVAGGGLDGGAATIDARRSSQFVSAVALAAPYARQDVELEFADGIVVSRPYVDTTVEVMEAFGAQARFDRGKLAVTAGQGYRGRSYPVEADASAAAYPLVAAAISGGSVLVEGIPEDSKQADLRLTDVLSSMGCRSTWTDKGLELRGPATGLVSVEADMNDMPDAVLAVAVAAAFAKGKTVISNVANLRLKETDRLSALETELRKLGARARAQGDSLIVEGDELHGAEIETYDDHRMAMAFTLAGFRVPGVVIRDPGCVAKTWPSFFEDMAALWPPEVRGGGPATGGRS